MRLIDADKLTGALNLWGCYKHENPKAYDTLMLYEILGAIEDQPTAYDVDEVVEELEKYGDKFSSENQDDWWAASIVSDCEEIVKRGGVDE